MHVISLKDYAEQKNISYEAVRQQVVRYKDELGGHIIRDGRQQFLDEEAVAFLDAKRQKNPVAIIQQNKDEQIEELENQVKQLLIKTATQADRLSELAAWKADNALLIAGAEQSRLALQAAQDALEETKRAADEERTRLERSLTEIEAQNAVLSDEKAKADDRARLEAKAAQKAAEELQRAEKEKAAWREYVAALEAYNALGWFKRRKADRPTPPIV